jgi:hypothetical protein
MICLSNRGGEGMMTPQDLKYLTWTPKDTWRIRRHLSVQERQQREEELTQQRQREREAWAAEKRRLGL